MTKPVPTFIQVCFVGLLFYGSANGSSASGLYGHWTTSDGSIIFSSPCSAQEGTLCLRIERVSPTAPGTVDAENPNAALRRRPLCGVEIGSGFHLEGNAKATGGMVYDPMSGKTYKGSIEAYGDTLKLRGFIGVSLFGRTETWHRTSAPTAGCPPS